MLAVVGGEGLERCLWGRPEVGRAAVMEMSHQKLLSFAITSARDGRRAPWKVVVMRRVCSCDVRVDEVLATGYGCGGCG